MEDNKKYNGWSNYATWRVSLEWFDGAQDEWYEDYGANVSDMAQGMKDHLEEMLGEEASGMALGYALSFVNDVNYYEIAKHIVDDLHHCGCEYCGTEVDPEDKFCSNDCKRSAYEEHVEERV